MMKMLLDACPSFAPRYTEFLEEWEQNEVCRNAEGGYDLPYYIAMSDLAQHLIGKLEAGEDDMILKFFDQIERLLLYGDDYSNEVVGVGLLEDLQNENLYREHPTVRPEEFRRFMQPETEHFWNMLYVFWCGKHLPEGVRIGKREQALIDEAEGGRPLLPDLSVWKSRK